MLTYTLYHELAWYLKPCMEIQVELQSFYYAALDVYDAHIYLLVQTHKWGWLLICHNSQLHNLINCLMLGIPMKGHFLIRINFIEVLHLGSALIKLDRQRQAHHGSENQVVHVLGIKDSFCQTLLQIECRQPIGIKVSIYLYWNFLQVLYELHYFEFVFGHFFRWDSRYLFGYPAKQYFDHRIILAFLGIISQLLFHLIIKIIIVF